jgi:uncharacterized membrane protein YqgA involved in biofilm formation
MTGTIINIIAVLIGGSLGTVLGNRLPARMRETVMHGLGLATLAIGIQLTLSQLSVAEDSLKRLTFIVVLASILVGGLLGEALDLEARLNSLGQWLEARTSRSPASSDTAPTSPVSTFSRGFVTASLVFCVGPMAIIGSLRDGLNGDYTLLAVKSVLDLFAALAFASTLGVGVIFSVLTILVYQGSLALASQWLAVILSAAAIAEMSAAGGILMLGIGLALLEIKRVRVANLLPAVFLAPVFTALAMPIVALLG